MTRFIRIREVEKITGLEKSTVYRRMAAGEFPKPVRLGESAQAVGWLESEVQGWVDARIAERDQATQGATA